MQTNKKLQIKPDTQQTKLLQFQDYKGEIRENCLKDKKYYKTKAKKSPCKTNKAKNWLTQKDSKNPHSKNY